MRILITEEALQKNIGHWHNYIGNIVKEFRKYGDHVDILTHRDASFEITDDLKSISWFSKNCWIDPKCQGLIGGVTHSLFFAKEVYSWLIKNNSYDLIFSLTTRLQHLIAFTLLVTFFRRFANVKFILLFVQGFGIYSDIDKKIIYPKTVSTLIARLCFKVLSSKIKNSKIYIAAETTGMKKELENFIDLPILLLPHPVLFNQNLDLIEEDENPQIITITCPGFARYEKGSDLLQEAIISLIDKPEFKNLRFIMQWSDSYKMPDGTTQNPNPILKNNSRIKFINNNLNEISYNAVLSKTNIIILPYRKSSYHNRVSRIAIEAAIKGLPLIYTKGTWSEEIANLVGTGLEIKNETSESIVDTIKNAISQYPKMKLTALKNAELVSKFYSPNYFRQKIVDL